ncbi:carbohydrate ABC transporter permease [Butyrivibrio sp. WCD3002]|uniref:carbohydrate ABC transporter permease n=1 Tax=Butyrivibrio sp. WCD3002 TaxID=1280676 RepID=UPI0004060D88|nr:carbohydrate ABC transporter permease [Butyrivibrio sp. WCD3002]
MRTYKNNVIHDKIMKCILYLAIGLLAVVSFFPFYAMIINATRSGVEISRAFSLIPSSHLVENYVQLIKFVNIPRGILNSILVSVPATLFTAYFSALAAYGLAFYKFKTNKIVFAAILIFMMIPGQLSLIGFYQLCTKLHLVNSYLPLILPAIASPGTVFFLRQYALSAVPETLIEAARLDGANELYTFHRIIIPILSPGIATMGIMTFIGNWNSYLLPMIILNKTEKFTLPVMVSTLRSATDLQQNQGATYLAVAISVIPIMLVFTFFSRYIISSISAGAVKE